MTFAGLPPTTTLSGIFFVTTEPDAITTLLPMVTPGLITDFPPIQTLSPIDTGFLYYFPEFSKVLGSVLLLI